MHLEALRAAATRPDTPDADTRALIAATPVRPTSGYELFRWADGGWKSEGRMEAGVPERIFERLPDDAIYWLVEDGSERLERIFTIEAGRQVFW
jgi:hypothetical protein